MLRSLGWAALGTGFTFLMTTLGAAMVFFLSGEPKPRFQKAMLGFAAGVMTAASVWSLLLPAISQASEEGKLPGWLPAAAGMLLGVVFLAALDALLPRLRRKKEADGAWRQNTLLMTAITLHNVPEGMAVGLAFALAAAVEGAAGAMALALGIGILVVLIAAWAHPMMPWLLSFAAGAMLYVVVEELVPQAHSRAGTCGFVGGFLIMMVLDVALG
ncbi:MAG: ZIP family metal transporter [Dysosmobacter sp.]|nr:ZIP family metal transporter [Dysosmobacter sp.]